MVDRPEGFRAAYARRRIRELHSTYLVRKPYCEVHRMWLLQVDFKRDVARKPDVVDIFVGHCIFLSFLTS
jgi:hypothetical protein